MCTRALFLYPRTRSCNIAQPLVPIIPGIFGMAKDPLTKRTRPRNRCSHMNSALFLHRSSYFHVPRGYTLYFRSKIMEIKSSWLKKYTQRKIYNFSKSNWNWNISYWKFRRFAIIISLQKLKKYSSIAMTIIGNNFWLELY